MSHCIKGVVESINDSGDLVTDIATPDLENVPRDDTVTVSVGDHATVGIFETDHNEPESTMIAVLGTSGFLEIGIVGLSMSDMLGIKQGTAVTISWPE